MLLFWSCLPVGAFLVLAGKHLPTGKQPHCFFHLLLLLAFFFFAAASWLHIPLLGASTALSLDIASCFLAVCPLNCYSWSSVTLNLLLSHPSAMWSWLIPGPCSLQPWIHLLLLLEGSPNLLPCWLCWTSPVLPPCWLNSFTSLACLLAWNSVTTGFLPPWVSPNLPPLP